MAKTDSPSTKQKYKVLDWGAGTEDSPCSIFYLPVGGTEPRRAYTGDIVDDLSITDIGHPGQEAFRNFILHYHIEAVD